MSTIDSWVMIRFDCKSDALGVAHRILRHVPHERVARISELDRITILSPSPLSPEAVLYLSPGAARLGRRLGITLNHPTVLPSEALPRTLAQVVRLEDNDPSLC